MKRPLFVLRPLVALLALATAAAAPAAAQTVPTRVGVLLDGPSEFNRTVLAEFQREIGAFFGAERVVDFPPAAIRTADWSATGVRGALDQLFADPGIAVVLALGPIGSHELARRSTVPKPAVAAFVIDAAVQQLPRRGGASGVRNLTYVDVAYAASRTVDLFHELVPFRRLAVLIHPALLDAIPQLRALGADRAAALGGSFTFVPVTSSAADALRALPPDADAAYLTPLDQLTGAGLDSLISGLTARRLPVFSYTGRAEVERGTLASYAPRDDLTRRARRVAGTLQRIRGGEDPGTLPVALPAVSQLTLNLATARAIGYSPTWQTLTEAELLHEQPPAAGPTWTLASVAAEAARVTLALRMAERQVAAGREDVRLARGVLLPQLQAITATTAIREGTAAAGLGSQAELQTEGQLSLSQVLVSDRARANRVIAAHAQEGRVADRRRTELDAVLEGVTAFLDVLRADAIARVERVNVRTTRSNLELAELRERTGSSTLADVYRWRAELAQGRRRLLDAEARAHAARLELNRLLNRPLEEPFTAADATVADSALVTSEPRLLEYFATPERFRVFRDFTVAEGLAAAPELAALDAGIAAQRRSSLASRRALWLPDISLGAGLSEVLDRGGAGSQPPTLGGMTLARGPDVTWRVQVKASLPLFTGFQRGATHDQASIELDRLALEREAVVLRLSATIRSALHLASASWAGIEQARLAASAARSNLDLISDAYARGAVNIITLLDAQEAALSADESAANAAYDFLLDLMQVQRTTGRFDFFRAPGEREAYFQRLDAYYRAAGAAPAPR